ncbi:MAG: hypothetical protein BGO55_18330 [Sphingobacteriales bacterium 50-39]|nr:hypothetical protein [Sphingobacteriales bacterium]OJW55024.1 MAG: hypothetical protein BGO55_18330 [Sphingobacteriales bacterium 50-39]
MLTCIKYLLTISVITLNFQWLLEHKESTAPRKYFQEKSDTIHWSSVYRLTYDDFQGIPKPKSNSDSDTLALCDYTIKYKIKMVGRDLKIEAFAVFERNTSWIRVKIPLVLNHEQGHFDIAEIYALRFEKIVNDTTIKDPHDFLRFLNESFKKIVAECNEEEGKYDIISMNTLGREQYSKWISEQLDSLAKGR